MAYEHLSNPVRALVTNLACVKIPNNMKEAQKNPEWKKAIMEEMEELKNNAIQVVIQKPKEKIPVGCKWGLLLNTRHMD